MSSDGRQQLPSNAEANPEYAAGTEEQFAIIEAFLEFLYDALLTEKTFRDQGVTAGIGTDSKNINLPRTVNTKRKCGYRDQGSPADYPPTPIFSLT
ncbi:hypothetical protein MMC28_011296 [Mycoblastus sanguinarius]|nr:hypothetical protein [Mycoblastus sanguinarius]